MIAHRGASGEYPENTILAFTRGLEQGADALEMDTRTTADGVPVIFHDEMLDRTTSARGPLRGMRLEQLRGVDAGAGEAVPTLADVLEQFPHTPIILEIKEASAVPAVKQVLERQGAARRVLAGAFAHSAVGPFGTGWHRSASRRESAWFWLAARLGLRAWKGPYAAFTLPERYGRLRVVEERLATLARRMQKPVHVWTVDDAAQGRRLRAMGVCGLITNYPARIRAAV